MPVVETIAGPLQGPVSFAGGSGPAASFKVGPATVPVDELLFIRFAEKAAPPGQAVVYLRGGDELRAAIRGGDESEIQVESDSVRPAGGAAPLRLPLEELRGIAFPRDLRAGKAGKVHRWLLGGRGPRAPREAGKKPQGEGDGSPEAPKAKDRSDAEDRVLLEEGAELSGTLVKIDAEAVHFQSGAAGEVKLPLDKVQAVSLAALAASRKEEREGGKAEGREGPAGPSVAAEA
ncbi:MAG: hypothetical protein ACRD2T_02655, partial [Thermoanaerobaculia bacterium]